MHRRRFGAKHGRNRLGFSGCSRGGFEQGGFWRKLRQCRRDDGIGRSRRGHGRRTLRRKGGRGGFFRQKEIAKYGQRQRRFRNGLWLGFRHELGFRRRSPGLHHRRVRRSCFRGVRLIGNQNGVFVRIVVATGGGGPARARRRGRAVLVKRIRASEQCKQCVLH